MGRSKSETGIWTSFSVDFTPQKSGFRIDYRIIHRFFGTILHIRTKFSTSVQRRFVYHKYQYVTGNFSWRIGSNRTEGRTITVIRPRNQNCSPKNRTCRTGWTCLRGKRFWNRSSLWTGRTFSWRNDCRHPREIGKFARSKRRNRATDISPYRCHAIRNTSKNRNQAVRWWSEQNVFFGQPNKSCRRSRRSECRTANRTPTT